MTKCLAYRWKGFEQASGWVMRGRCMHDLLATAFVRIYPARVVAQARARLAAAVAAGADVNGEAMQALNRCVRGGDTI